MFVKGLSVRVVPFTFPERGVAPSTTSLPQKESAFKMNVGWNAGRVVGCVSRPGIAIVVFVILILNLCNVTLFQIKPDVIVLPVNLSVPPLSTIVCNFLIEKSHHVTS